MALVAMPLANGDLTMNHLVSEKWPCLTTFEKRASKARIPLQKFHWPHFREINTLESRACTFAPAANGEHRKSYPRQRRLVAKSQHDNNINAAFKAHGVSRRIENFLTMGSRSIISLTLPKVPMMK